MPQADSPFAEAKPEASSKISQLLLNMQQKQDFPVISQQIIEIVQKSKSSSDASSNMLANAILQDVSLSSKLLRVVNSPLYSHYGSRISTVSRAVVILGFETVRNVALGLMLLDHLQDKMQIKRLRESCIGAIFSANISQHLAKSLHVADLEEAYVCTMFHSLGKLLSLYYFPKQSQTIEQTVIEKGLEEKEVSESILGASYESLGLQVAKVWQLPKDIQQCMHSLPSAPLNKPLSKYELLQHLANFSTQYVQQLRHLATDNLYQDSLSPILDQFRASLCISPQQMDHVLQLAVEDMQQFSELIHLDFQHSDVYLHARQWLETQSTQQMQQLEAPADNKTENEEKQAANAEQETKSTGQDSSQAQAPLDEIAKSAPPDDEPLKDEQENSRAQQQLQSSLKQQTAILHALQETTEAILENASLTDILTMVMETIYTELEVDRVMFCFMNKSHTSIEARFGFGADVEAIINRFSLPNGGEDIFNLALKQGDDLIVENTRDENMDKLIPRWYLQQYALHSLLVFPIIVKHRPMGLLYIDTSREVSLADEGLLSELKTLRNQITLALMKKRI